MHILWVDPNDIEGMIRAQEIKTTLPLDFLE